MVLELVAERVLPAGDENVFTSIRTVSDTVIEVSSDIACVANTGKERFKHNVIIKIIQVAFFIRNTSITLFCVSNNFVDEQEISTIHLHITVFMALQKTLKLLMI